MSGYIDFEAVKSQVKIEDAVSMLGLELKEKNGQLRGPCPVCEKGGPRAFCVTPAKQKWFCFGCQTGGDVIQLAAHIRGEHQKDAAHFLMGTNHERPEEKSNNEGPKVSSEDGFKPLDYLQPAHEAVGAIGFEAEDAERIGLGYAPRGVMRGMVAVPIRLSDGKLIGYIGIEEAVLPKEWRW